MIAWTPFAAGLAAGLGIALPLGAIGVLILREGVERGIRAAGEGRPGHGSFSQREGMGALPDASALALEACLEEERFLERLVGGSERLLQPLIRPGEDNGAAHKRQEEERAQAGDGGVASDPFAQPLAP